MHRALLLTIGLITAACNGLTQSPQCQKFMACSQAIDAMRAAGYQSSYGPSGTCWSTDQRSADDCTKVCEQATQILAATSGRDKAECQ